MSAGSMKPLVAKQAAYDRVPYEKLAPGQVALVHAPSDVVFGRAILLASESGRYVDAAGIVIGQTVRKKHEKNTREIFVTNRFPQQSLDTDKPLKLTARSATARELTAYRDVLAASAKSSYEYVRLAAEVVAEDLGPARQTKETRCARVLVECAKARGFTGDTEVQLQASLGSSKTGSRPARADAVIRLKPKGSRERILVIETEWSKPGGAESAAQAWEYAARMKFKGGIVGDLNEIGVASGDFASAEILTCVVANDVPDLNLVGDQLGVQRMHYFEFLKELRTGSFEKLTPIPRTARVRTRR